MRIIHEHALLELMNSKAAKDSVIYRMIVKQFISEWRLATACSKYDEAEIRNKLAVKVITAKNSAEQRAYGACWRIINNT
jgi:hypothetical protein